MQIAQTLDFQQEAIRQGIPFANTIASPEAGFGGFLSNILSGVMVIAVLMVLLYLIWGAIEWISSGGDKGKVEKARNRMTQAVIGLIVLAATLALMTIVQNFLGVRLLNFGGGGGTGNSTGGGGNAAMTCNGTAIGAVANDGGSGGYCTGGGAAKVQCHGPDKHLSYAHFDPCGCYSGSPVAGYDFSTCR